MVIDFESDKVQFKDNPGVWHKLPTTNDSEQRLLMLPLTEEAVERTKRHQEANHLTIH